MLGYMDFFPEGQAFFWKKQTLVGFFLRLFGIHKAHRQVWIFIMSFGCFVSISSMSQLDFFSQIFTLLNVALSKTSFESI
jgi:hypothetical protein